MKKDLFKDLDTYLEENLERVVLKERMVTGNQMMMDTMYTCSELPDRELKDLVNNRGETFSRMLIRLIDEKGYDDVTIYKRANLDRKLFSKIRCNDDYSPSKKTVTALCFALKLSLDEALDLYNTAGYDLSHSNKSDIIVEYFLTNEIYDLYLLNETLVEFGEKEI